MPDSHPQLTTLSNGVRLFVEPLPHLRSVAMGVWVAAGALDERPEENGAAHLLEHMAFKGTARRSAKAIAEEIEAIGGHINAATSYPYTGYYARFLAGDEARVMDVLSDIILNAALNPDELSREQEVVIQEIGEAADTPDDVLYEHLQSLTYTDQSLGRPILGTPETVRNQSQASLRAFIARHYTPKNTVIAVSGCVDPGLIIDLAEHAFGAMPTAPNGVSADSSASARKSVLTFGRRHDDRPLEQTHIAVALPGAGVRDPSYYGTRLLAEVLGGGMSSRLFQEVREERGYAYSVYAYADAYDDIGTLGFYLGVDEKDAADALRLSLAQLEALATETTASELERARAMLRSSLLMGLESPMVRIERAAVQTLTFGAPVPIEKSLDELAAVSCEDVKDTAARVLAAGARSLAVVGPASFDRLSDILTP
ncbi:MAG: pitrilysin family protein [Pseudomonadota bacterium]